MKAEYIPAYVVLIFISIILFTSGSAVPQVDFTSSSEELGDGTAEISVVSSPNQLNIDRGRFGTDVYYLRVPDTVVHVDSVDGSPRIVYDFSSPELGIDVTKKKYLRGTEDEKIRLDIGHMALEESAIKKESYEANLTVNIQSFETYKTVYESEMEVEVTE